MIFYPFSLVEMLVLAALECLYQSNYKKDCTRHGALIVTNSKQRILEYYLGLSLAHSPLWRLFGKADGIKQPVRKQHAKSRMRLTFEKKLEVVSPGRLSHVDDLEKFSVIILGVRTTWGLGKVSETMSYARRGEIPTLLVFEPWYQIRKARLYNELLFHIYGWSSAELNDLNPKLSGRNHVVLQSPDSVPSSEEMPKTNIEVLPRDSCSDLFESLTPLVHSLFSSESTRGYAGTVYGISRDLLRLAVPLKAYDFECLGSFFKSPIADRVKRLKEQIDQIPEEQATGSLRKARLLLSDLCDRFGTGGNQKYEVMLQRLRGSLATRTPAALIFSNVQERTAFEKSLSALETPIPLDLPSQLGVQIGSFDSLPRVPAAAEKKLKGAIFSTYPPLGRTNQVVDWLVAHCETSTVILRKPEAEAFRFFEKDAENLRIFLFSPVAKDKTLTDLALGKPATRLAIPRTGAVEVQEPLIDTAPSYSHKDLLKLLIEFDETGTIATAPQHPATVAKESSTTLPGLLVHFAEGGTLALKRSKYVYKYMEAGKVKPVRSERLKPGDVIVLVDMSVNKSLNELFLEKASNYPKFRFLEELVRKWIRALRQGMAESGDTPRKMLLKLGARGSSIRTSTAIYFWRNGLVVGPHDFEDIKRIAQIYSKPELEENFEGITRAIREFRHLRIEVLHSLKQSLILGEKSTLERIGMDIEEFADAIAFMTVSSVVPSDKIDVEEFNRVSGFSI